MKKDIRWSVLFAAMVWFSIATLHFFATYADALKYNTEAVLELTNYSYYLLAYSGWVFVSVASFSIMKAMTPERFTQGVIIVGFGLVAWVFMYFYYDHLAYTAVFKTPLRSPIDVLRGTQNALYFLYVLMSALTFMMCLSVVMYQRKKAETIQVIQAKQLAAEAARDLSDQKLKLLQSQLSPHFLFNCLSAISALVRTNDKEKMLSSVSRIGSLLRHAIGASQQTQVLLQEELDFVADYISLQQLRFADRFSYEAHINVENNFWVLPLLLQPLIENAFEHAVSKTQEYVNIVFDVSQSNQSLIISITNTHPSSEQSGLGSSVKNIRNRLSLAYQDRASLETTVAPNSYKVRLSLPILTEPQYA